MFGTKQGKTRPRATWPRGSPEASCSPAVIGSIWAAGPSGSRLGFGKQIKGFEWEKIRSLLGRSSLSGKAGVARWSLEEGAGIFHFHWLLLQMWDCEPRGVTADSSLVLAGSLLSSPSCLPKQVAPLCPHPFLGTGCIRCLVVTCGCSAPLLSPGKDQTAAAAAACHPNASKWGRAWGPVLQGSNRCK